MDLVADAIQARAEHGRPHRPRQRHLRAPCVGQKRAEDQVLAEVSRGVHHVDAGRQHLGLQVLQPLEDQRDDAVAIVEGVAGVRRHEEDEQGPQRDQNPAHDGEAICLALLIATVRAL